MRKATTERTIEDEGTVSGALERLAAAMNLLEAVLATSIDNNDIHVSVCNAAALLVEDAIALASDGRADFPDLADERFKQMINGAHDLLAACDNDGMTQDACYVVLSALRPIHMQLLRNCRQLRVAA